MFFFCPDIPIFGSITTEFDTKANANGKYWYVQICVVRWSTDNFGFVEKYYT